MENWKLKDKTGQVHIIFWKFSIKALSVAPDGRESAVVTKVFKIEQKPPETDKTIELSADCADVLLTKKVNPPQKKEKKSFIQKHFFLTKFSFFR